MAQDGERGEDQASALRAVVGRAIDLTDRSDLPEPLAMLMALEAGGFGWWEHRIAEHTLVASAIAKAHFGLSPDADFTYQDWLAALHPDDEADRTAALAHTLATGEPYVLNARVRSGDGALRWLEIKGRLMTDAEGRPERLVGVTLDVTEARRAELALRESEERSA